MLDVIKQAIDNYVANAKLTDLTIGTVSNDNPLEVKLQQTMLPIPKECLYLTNAVVEKTMDIVKHKHSYYDSDTGQGASGSATRETDEQLTNVQVYENGVALGLNKEKDKIIINKGLQKDDKVLLLRVKNGQRFIILSRLY